MRAIGLAGGRETESLEHHDGAAWSSSGAAAARARLCSAPRSARSRHHHPAPATRAVRTLQTNQEAFCGPVMRAVAPLKGNA